jgi:hypothetical protein
MTIVTRARQIPSQQGNFRDLTGKPARSAGRAAEADRILLAAGLRCSMAIPPISASIPSLSICLG